MKRTTKIASSIILIFILSIELCCAFADSETANLEDEFAQYNNWATLTTKEAFAELRDVDYVVQKNSKNTSGYFSFYNKDKKPKEITVVYEELTTKVAGIILHYGNSATDYKRLSKFISDMSDANNGTSTIDNESQSWVINGYYYKIQGDSDHSAIKLSKVKTGKSPFRLSICLSENIHKMNKVKNAVVTPIPTSTALSQKDARLEPSSTSQKEYGVGDIIERFRMTCKLIEASESGSTEYASVYPGYVFLCLHFRFTSKVEERIFINTYSFKTTVDGKKVDAAIRHPIPGKETLIALDWKNLTDDCYAFYEIPDNWRECIIEVQPNIIYTIRRAR